MAQKTIAIGIKISSEGQEKVITNLQGLEQELVSLQTKLKTLDFGSAAFVEATTNIQKLKTKIDDIDKATEGLGAEKRFNAINASVGILTSSFQILSGVIGIFISDTEDLEKVQRAEAQAVGVLNTTLGILQIRREIEDQQITTAKIKEAALNGVRKISIGLQKAYNAVLKANPIGLVITAVVALTAAYALLNRRTKENKNVVDELKVANEEANKINKEGNVIRDKELEKIAPLIAITEKENVSKKNRKAAIQAIQKEYPDYLKNQDLDKLTTEQIKSANDSLVVSLGKLARSRAAVNELTRIYTEELKIEQDREERAIARQKALDEAYKTGRADVIEGTKQTNKSLEAINEAQLKNRQQTLDIQKKVALGFIDEADAINQATGATNANTKATDKNDAAQAASLKIINDSKYNNI